jgi:hypothetical protein
VINPASVKDLRLDFQIGTLQRFMSSYLVTSYKDVLFILDPVNTRIIGSCHELRSILDIASTDSEIFVLESDRTLLRLSHVPDKIQTYVDSYYTDFFKGAGMIPNIMSASIADFRLPQEPMTFLTSKIKETSRALPKINSTFLSTLKNVIEFDMEVQDGQFTVPPPVITLKDSDIPHIRIEDSEVCDAEYESPAQANGTPPNNSSEDKFKHISSQPFEDILVQPQRKLRHRKKKAVKQNPPFQLSGDTMTSDAISLCSAYSTNSEGDNASRKLSSQSDSAQFIALGCEASLSGSHLSSDRFFPGGMSQSWSIGQINGLQAEVSLSDLETKEEILARKLKWPELLPPSARHISLDDETQPDEESDKRDQKDPIQIDVESPRSAQTPTSDDAMIDDGLDGGSSIVTLREARSSSIDDLNNSASRTALLMQLEANGSLYYGTIESPDEEDTLFNPFDHSVDIYSKYAPFEEPTTGSISSVLSFGPPSGCSTLDGVPRSIDEFPKQPVIVESKEEIMTFSSEPISAAYEDLMYVRGMVVDPIVIENDSWVSYKAPADLLSISSCDAFVVCIDSKNNVYYSRLGDVSLRWVQAEYQASQVAVSSCGTVVWRLYKGVLYSLTNATNEDPIGLKNGQWSKLTANVISMSVKLHSGWIVKTDGTVQICTELGESSVIPEFRKVPCPWSIGQICVLGNNVWAVTLDGQAVYRTGVTDYDSNGLGWAEKHWDVELPLIRTLCVGPNNSIWIADVQSNVYFISEVLTKNSGELGPWKVSFGEYTPSGSPSIGRSSRTSNGSSSNSYFFNNLKSRISDSLRPDRLTYLLSAKSYPILSGCGSSVWHSSTGSRVLNVSKTQAEGQSFMKEYFIHFLQFQRLIRLPCRSLMEYCETG